LGIPLRENFFGLDFRKFFRYPIGTAGT